MKLPVVLFFDLEDPGQLLAVSCDRNECRHAVRMDLANEGPWRESAVDTLYGFGPRINYCRCCGATVSTTLKGAGG